MLVKDTSPSWWPSRLLKAGAGQMWGFSFWADRTMVQWDAATIDPDPVSWTGDLLLVQSPNFTSAFLSLLLGKVGMKLFIPSEVEVEALQHLKASWHRRVIKIAINTFSSLCEQCRRAGWDSLKGNSNKQTVRLQAISSQLGSWPGRWQEGECLGSSDLGLLSAPPLKHNCLSCLPSLREEAVCLLQSLRYQSSSNWWIFTLCNTMLTAMTGNSIWPWNSDFWKNN